VLEAWGLGQPLRGQAALVLAPKRLSVGQSLQLTVTLNSRSPRAQTLLIDYVVHHVKANGSTSPKVFKGWQIELGGREQRVLVKQHSMREITTRRCYPGRHAVELQINGAVLARADFDLRP
jgi:hypothetical protein